MVTRTFTTTVAVIMLVGKENKEVTNVTMFFQGKITNEGKILKLAKKQYSNDPCVPVAVMDVSYRDELRGVTEEVFYSNSEVLPSRNKKEDNN